MKNRLAIIAAAALLMTGCGTAAETTDAETTAEAVSAESEATETTTEQPSGETTENEAPHRRLRCNTGGQYALCYEAR